MKLKEYQDLALARLSPTIANKDKESMRFCCLGLLEETGEVAAELRKPLYKGNFHEKPLNKNSIKEELGDLIWYITLICRNNCIDVNQIDIREYGEYKGEFDREKIIKKGIKIGRQSGIIVKRYINYDKKKIEKEKLEKSIIKQYKNILKICNFLDIQIDDILKENIEKVNSRYDKYGHVKALEEDER